MNPRERERIRREQHVNSNLTGLTERPGEYNDPFENVDLQDPATYDTPELFQPAVLEAAPPPPTFTEAMMSSAGMTWREETSLSRRVNRNERYAPRAELIDRLHASGDIPESVITAFTRPGRTLHTAQRDDDGIAQWRQAQGHLDLDTDEQLDEGIRDTLKEQRVTHQTLMQDADFAATAGAMTGSLVAMADPINIASMAIPIVAPVAGAGRLVNAARVGTSAALANMMAETAVQMAVVPYKEEIDSHYPAGQIAANIALAGVGGFGLGGAVGALQAPIRPSARGLSALQEAQRLAPANSAERQAIDAAIEEQGPLYNPIDAEGDVTPERMNEVAAEAEALPPQVLVGEEGAPDVNLQAEAAKQDQRVKAIDEIWGCMFGGPDG